MTNDLIQQVEARIKTGKQAAILLSQEPTLDALVSAFALQSVITAQGNTATIFSAAKSLPVLHFFEVLPPVVSSLATTSEFAVKISNSHAQPGELRYDMLPDGVVIYLKPKQGEFKPSDVTITPAIAKADVVFTLGVASPEQLGALYTDNPKLFFENPVVNIDVNPANEYYGAVNAINTNTTSIAEHLMDIALLFPESLKQDLVSTGLLAGIIEQTQSFRDPKTTPVTLSKAAQLIEAGARQQDIIQHLFKTKPFPVLQLWGRALARLTSVPDKSLLYSGLTKADMERTSGNPSTLIEVLRDLIEMVSGFNVIALAADTDSGIEMLVAGVPHAKVTEIIQKLGAPAALAHPLLGKYEYVHTLLPAQPLGEIQRLLEQAVVS